MTIQERLAKGEYLVPNLLNDEGSQYALKVGDPYKFKWLEYKVIELGEGDLAGYCWIGINQ